MLLGGGSFQFAQQPREGIEGAFFPCCRIFAVLHQVIGEALVFTQRQPAELDIDAALPVGVPIAGGAGGIGGAQFIRQFAVVPEHAGLVEQAALVGALGEIHRR